MSLKDVLSLSATITTIGQFLSGSFTAFKVFRLGSPADLSSFPFLTSVVGCSLWMFYGSVIEDVTIYYTNVIGVCLNSLYVAVFLFFSHKKVNLFQQILVAGVFLGVVVLYIGSIEEQIFRKNRLGLICVVITLLCCASPLIALKNVLETKSTETLPFPLILSMFLVCSQWWLYGVLISDFYMQITNLLGTIIALVQLSLFVIYPSSSSSSRKKSVPTVAPHLYAPLKSQIDASEEVPILSNVVVVNNNN